MQDSTYIETEAKSPNLKEIFGDSDRYVYTKVLGQGAYGIVWYEFYTKFHEYLNYFIFQVRQKINILALKLPLKG